MCNFYMMYYVKGDNLLDDNICFAGGPPSWYFKNFKSSTGERLDLSKIPADASEVPAEQLAELEQMKKSGHGMHGMHHEAAVSKSDDMSMHEMNMEMNNHQHHMDQDESNEEQDDEVAQKLERDLDELETELRLRRLLQKLSLKNNN